ncbi:MAG: hypothetical protein GXO90_11260 [FCB group bacterium]|nr:hypothetical protein [FCB group bacterium]
MKKIMLITIALGLWSCGSKQSVSLDWNRKPFADVLNQNQGKIIFVEFYTDW